MCVTITFPALYLYPLQIPLSSTTSALAGPLSNLLRNQLSWSVHCHQTDIVWCAAVSISHPHKALCASSHTSSIIDLLLWLFLQGPAWLCFSFSPLGQFGSHSTAVSGKWPWHCSKMLDLHLVMLVQKCADLTQHITPNAQTGHSVCVLLIPQQMW